REDARRGEAEGPGLGALRACGENFDRRAFPGCGVDDGLAVGREARRRHVAAAEGDLLEARHPRDYAPAAGQEACPEDSEEAERNESRAETARPDARGDARTGPARARGRGQRLELEGEVARGLEALPRPLLQAVTDDPVQGGVQAPVALDQVRRL